MLHWNNFIPAGGVCRALLVCCGLAAAWSGGSAAQTPGSSVNPVGATVRPMLTEPASQGLPDYRSDAWLREAPAASDTPEQRLRVWREANDTVGRLGGHAGHVGGGGQVGQAVPHAPASGAPFGNSPTHARPASRGQP